MFEKLDNYLLNRRAWWIYPSAIFFIIYFDKYDYVKVLNILMNITTITLFWILFIIIPRKYFMKQIINVNIILLKYFPFILRLRKEFINLPFLLRIILSLFISVDMILIKILYLETRKKNLFYFLRAVLYYNIIILMTLPFYFIVSLYKIITEFIDNYLEVLNYLKLRINFLILSIIFISLFNISRIDIIIAIWVLDTLIMIYKEWYRSWIEITEEGKKGNTWIERAYVLQLSFNNIGMSYDRTAHNLIFFEDERDSHILLFKGLNTNQIGIFVIMKKIRDITRRYWNNIFYKYGISRHKAWLYYSYETDDQFILNFLVELIDTLGYEEFLKFYKKNDIEKIVNDEIDLRFYKKINRTVYKYLYNFLDNEELIKEFYVLKEKYPFELLGNFTEEKDVKAFLDKINKD